MNFYPFNDIETISPRPMLFITGDQAHSREFSEDAYKRAAEPKELVWVPGAGHVDLYDRVNLIPFDKLESLLQPAPGISWPLCCGALISGGLYMLKPTVGSALIAIFVFTGSAMAQERVRISSDWGEVTAELVDNAATRSLVGMLPVTIDMHDHLRQEKTGDLPAPLPEVERQRDFAVGTLGLWNSDHFVIYYRSGRVPSPGIIILGNVTGDVALFDRSGPVTVRVERIQ